MRRGRWLLWGSGLAVLALDQWSKRWVRIHLPPATPTDIFPALHPILSFTYVHNTGVAFGLFPQLGWLFTVLALGVVLFILCSQQMLGEESWLLNLALGLQLGGAAGNLLDRLLRGAVTDFLDVNFWPLESWPVFNVADSAIVVGVGLLILHILLEERAERRRTTVAPVVDDGQAELRG